jgi:hypothetical protein
VRIAFHPMGASRAFHERYVELARAQLGAEAFEAARTAGRGTSVEQAVAHATACSTA